MTAKKEYWVTYKGLPEPEYILSKHKILENAKKAKEKIEKTCGTLFRIVEVREVVGYKK